MAGSHVQDARQQLTKEDTFGETRFRWLAGCRNICFNIVIVSLVLVPIFMCSLKASISKVTLSRVASHLPMLCWHRFI